MVQIKLLSSVSDEKVRKLEEYGIKRTLQSDYHLELQLGGWIVSDSQNRKLRIHFDDNKKDYARKNKGGGEPLAKALGWKEGVRHVLDLSAGLAIDTVFLAQIGFQVTSIERHPLLAFLLSEAQQETQQKVLKQIYFVQADAFDFLSSWKTSAPTSAYFDPMYPEKKKSALPRQEMVLFREMVGSDTDARKVLERSMMSPLKRIVVKRPVKAEPLIEKPAYQLETKLVRYDVYYGQGKV